MGYTYRHALYFPAAAGGSANATGALVLPAFMMSGTVGDDVLPGPQVGNLGDWLTWTKPKKPKPVAAAGVLVLPAFTASGHITTSPRPAAAPPATVAPVSPPPVVPTAPPVPVAARRSDSEELRDLMELVLLGVL